MTDASGAYDRFRHWAATLLAHQRAGSEVYQFSTIGALLDGVYDGDVTVAEILRHGDFGLGTFNHLDGEMVVLDGVCYRVRADGTATRADPTDRSPFAAVTRFHADFGFDITEPTGMAAVLDAPAVVILKNAVIMTAAGVKSSVLLLFTAGLAVLTQVLMIPYSLPTAALIVPAGLMNKLRGDEPADPVAATFAADAAARSRIEHLAMSAVRQAEEARGCRVVDVSAAKCGWDLTSYPPAVDGRQPDPKHIEVKGRVKGASTITITRNEMLYALNQRDKFILAIVLPAPL